MNRFPARAASRRTGARASIASIVAASALLAPADAQSPVVLADGSGLTVEIGVHGISRIRMGADTWRFVATDPLVVRLTELTGGQVTWRDVRGDELVAVRTRVRASSSTRCTVSRSRCRIPGIPGSFDLVHEYELVPAPHGPGVAIRGQLVESSLAVGIASVGYRQFVASDAVPQTVFGGFTGAVEVQFDDLANGTLQTQHPYLASGGVTELGYPGETYLTTRTSESLLVAATYDPARGHGLIVTRDGRNDPDNLARELGFFGAHDVQSDQRSELGFGMVGYLPNDDRPANGGATPAIGSGLVVGLVRQENPTDPYWDIVRAYRARWVDPMLAGIDKTAARPAWMSRSMYMVLNVASHDVVQHDAVADFIEEYLVHNDQVRDLAVLLWGATDAHRWQPLMGLHELVRRLDEIETRTGATIRPSLYYLPTGYRADASGGTRLDEVCRDPFGAPVRFANALGNFTYRLDTGGAANGSFFTSWLDQTLPSLGIQGIYFDDAYRHRSFYSYHYDPSLTAQGRSEAIVAGYVGHFEKTNAYFANHGGPGYITTELGMLGRSVPGNVVQGGPDIVQSLGPLFESAQREVRFRPFLNDVAGHHWLSGYSGDIAHHWLSLADYDDILYFATPVVHGLVPVQSPFPARGQYYDFFQLCRDGLIDCSDPRFRAVQLHSDYANAAMGFFRRHNDVLTSWRRQPLPGSHDIVEHEVRFNGPGGAVAYQVGTPEIPHGCFTADDRLAIAVTNPKLDQRVVSFRLQRDRYGIMLNGPYRVTLQLASEAEPRVVLQQATGDFAFSVTLPSREFAMVMVEPVACSFADLPNTTACTGGGLAGAATSTNGDHDVQLTVAGAPALALGALVFGGRASAMPLPGSNCQLLVDLQGALTLPVVTDASGEAVVNFRLTRPTVARLQCLTLDASRAAVVGTNGLLLECR